MKLTYPQLAKLLTKLEDKEADLPSRVYGLRNAFRERGSALPPSVEVLVAAIAKARADVVPAAKKASKVAAKMDAKVQPTEKDLGAVDEFEKIMRRLEMLQGALTREANFYAKRLGPRARRR